MITTGLSLTYYDILDTTLATEYEDGSVTVKVSYKDESSYATDKTAQSVEITFALEATGMDYLAAFEAALLENSGTEAYTFDKSVDVTDTAAIKAAAQAILETAHADLLSTFDVETYITTGIKITYYDVVSVVPATESETGSVVVKVSYKDNSTYAADTSAHSVEVTFTAAQATIDRATPFGEAVAELSGTAAYTIDKSVDAADVDALKTAANAVLSEVHADLLSEFDSETLITTGVKITYFDVIDVVLASEYEAGSATIKVSYKDESTYAADTAAQSVEVTFILEPTADVVVDTVEMTTYASTYDAVTLNWEAVEGATGYRVYMLVDGVYTKVAQVSGLTTSVEALSANSEYSFVVKAFFRWPDSSITWGEASADYVVSTATAQTELTSFTRTYDAVRVNWDSVDGADGYRVYMLVGEELVKVATVYGEDTTTYRLDGLNANTSYVFYVNSFVRDAEGVAHFLTRSDYFVATTRTEQVEMTTYTRTDDAIRVNWESVSGADGYRVYMLVDGEITKVVTLYGEDIETYRISGLESETEYTFYVNSFVRNDDGVAKFLTISDAFNATTI